MTNSAKFSPDDPPKLNLDGGNAATPSFSTVLESARTKLEQLVAAGHARCSETVFQLFPDVATDEDAAVEIAYTEFVLKEEQGSSPTAEEFCGRFPKLADRLQRLMQFDRILGAHWSADGVPSDTTDESVSGNLTLADRLHLAPHGQSIEHVGHYECCEILGRGGMGVVYRAVHRTLNRQVALKTIQVIDSTDPKVVSRFLAEARVAGSLNHSGIVQVYDTGVHDGLPYYAMEFISGGNLLDVLRDGPLLPTVAAQVVMDLAHAVAAAHSKSIIHRDLKPANVLLAPVAGTQGRALRPGAPRYQPKIADFGLAKCMLETSLQTRAGVPIGTPSYMAPEQISQPEHADQRCDVYSLGAILYHLVTGKPPFYAATTLETLQAVASEQPLSPRMLQPMLSKDLETICLQCLSKSPDHRYATASDLADDLQRFLDRKPIRARAIGPIERSIKWAVCHKIATLLIMTVAIGITFVVGLWYRSERYRRTAEATNASMRSASDQTLNALRAMTEGIVFDKIAKQSELSTEDREFLDSIGAMYSQLASIQVQGNDADLIRAEGHYCSGVINASLLEPDSAAQNFHDALTIYSKLESVKPSEPLFHRANSTLESLVEVLENANRFDEAILVVQRRIRRCEQPTTALSSAGQTECLHSLCNAYRQLAYMHEMRGETNSATVAWRTAERLLEQRLKSHPDDVAAMNSLAGTLRSLGSQPGNWDERIANLDRSIAIARRLATRFSQNGTYQRNLAWSLYDRAFALQEQQLADQAIVTLDEAVELSESLVAVEPLLADYRGQLAVLLRCRGETLMQLERYQDAQANYRRTIHLVLENMENSPEAPVLHSEMTQAWIGLARAQFETADRAAAVDSYRSAERAMEALKAISRASGTGNHQVESCQRSIDELARMINSEPPRSAKEL